MYYIKKYINDYRLKKDFINYLSSKMHNCPLLYPLVLYNSPYLTKDFIHNLLNMLCFKINFIQIFWDF
jgi:hypothetical protein